MTRIKAQRILCAYEKLSAHADQAVRLFQRRRGGETPARGGSQMSRRRGGAAGGEVQPDLGAVSETATGIPDDAVGPDQSSVDELLALSQGPAVDAMAAKLQAEADARRVATPRAPLGRPDGGSGD